MPLAHGPCRTMPQVLATDVVESCRRIHGNRLRSRPPRQELDLPGCHIDEMNAGDFRVPGPRQDLAEENDTIREIAEARRLDDGRRQIGVGRSVRYFDEAESLAGIIKLNSGLDIAVIVGRLSRRGDISHGKHLYEWVSSVAEGFRKTQVTPRILAQKAKKIVNTEDASRQKHERFTRSRRFFRSCHTRTPLHRRPGGSAENRCYVGKRPGPGGRERGQLQSGSYGDKPPVVFIQGGKAAREEPTRRPPETPSAATINGMVS